MRMGDLRVLESPDDVQHRIDVAEVAEEAVAEPFTGMRSSHEPRNVHELDLLWHALLDSKHVSEAIESLVRDADHRNVWIDRRERIRRGLGVSMRESVEERRLPGVRKTDDADLHRHHALLGSAPAGDFLRSLEPGKVGQRRAEPAFELEAELPRLSAKAAERDHMRIAEELAHHHAAAGPQDPAELC
jgi:hypothetical protein